MKSYVPRRPSVRRNLFSLVAASVPVLLLAAGVAGCTKAPQAVVASSASREFACPAERIDVEGVGGSTFQATGCGMTAAYSCSGGGGGALFSPACARAGQATVLGGADVQGR